MLNSSDYAKNYASTIGKSLIAYHRFFYRLSIEIAIDQGNFDLYTSISVNEQFLIDINRPTRREFTEIFFFPLFLNVFVFIVADLPREIIRG